jgi:hypothetical protein
MTAVVDFVELETRTDQALGCPVLVGKALNFGESRIMRVAHVVNDDNIVAFLQQLERRMGADETESTDDQNVVRGVDILRKIGVDEVIVNIAAAN